MIELLGIGTPRVGGGWLLHRVCARIPARSLVAVTSADAAERRALLDALTARRVPDEGRAWVDGVPVMRSTARRVRELVGDADPAGVRVEHRSALWNTLAGPRPVLVDRLLKFPKREDRSAALRALSAVGLGSEAHVPVAQLAGGQRARLAIAGALATGPRHLVVRDLDRLLGPEDVAAVLAMLRGVTRAEGVSAVVSLRALGAGAAEVDRVLALADGLLVFDGTHGELAAADRRRRVYPASGPEPARA
jgi:ABC-type phosphate/phosphonate transport system ATPase subunit